LLVGVVFEVLFTLVVIATPGLDSALGMAVPPPATLALIAAFPVIVWGADELRRRAATRRAATGRAATGRATTGRAATRDLRP
jgi:tetrahydromethanopterin S-methyltransferase subunit C